MKVNRKENLLIQFICLLTLIGNGLVVYNLIKNKEWLWLVITSIFIVFGIIIYIIGTIKQTKNYNEVGE